jgi:Cys-tRNA(Pro) deacylase
MSQRRAGTPALKALVERGTRFNVHLYRYRQGTGAIEASRQLGIPPRRIIKTLVFKDEKGRHFLVLMHGDMEVSTKALARTLGVRAVSPASPRDARRVTGYEVGRVSPFGTRTELPVYMESSILGMPTIL